MPCSICGSITHHANDCTSVELLQSVARIKALWLGENMPEGWTDELVKNWCATYREMSELLIFQYFIGFRKVRPGNIFVKLIVFFGFTVSNHKIKTIILNQDVRNWRNAHYSRYIYICNGKRMVQTCL